MLGTATTGTCSRREIASRSAQRSTRFCSLKIPLSIHKSVVQWMKRRLTSSANSKSPSNFRFLFDSLVLTTTASTNSSKTIFILADSPAKITPFFSTTIKSNIYSLSLLHTVWVRYNDCWTGEQFWWRMSWCTNNDRPQRTATTFWLFDSSSATRLFSIGDCAAPYKKSFLVQDHYGGGASNIKSMPNAVNMEVRRVASRPAQPTTMDLYFLWVFISAKNMPPPHENPDPFYEKPIEIHKLNWKNIYCFRPLSSHRWCSLKKWWKHELLYTYSTYS